MEITEEGVMYRGRLLTHLEALKLIAEIMEGTQAVWNGQDFTHSDMYYSFKYSYFGEIGGIWVKED